MAKAAKAEITRPFMHCCSSVEAAKTEADCADTERSAKAPAWRHREHIEDSPPPIGKARVTEARGQPTRTPGWSVVWRSSS
jgi:hypothetical protein